MIVEKKNPYVPFCGRVNRHNSFHFHSNSIPEMHLHQTGFNRTPLVLGTFIQIKRQQILLKNAVYNITDSELWNYFWFLEILLLITPITQKIDSGACLNEFEENRFFEKIVFYFSPVDSAMLTRHSRRRTRIWKYLKCECLPVDAVPEITHIHTNTDKISFTRAC